MHPDDTRECFRAHLGLWAIEPVWLQQAIRALQMGLWPIRAFDGGEPQRLRSRETLYTKVDEVALIRIVDQMQKGLSVKFNGTSTILTKRAIRQALDAEDIRSIVLAIDSPGGMVAGTMELADAVRQATEQKPVLAYIEDLGASAAYWVASQAQRITANAVAQIGSIGVVAEVVDSSGMAEREGLKVHIISTGPYKGLGAPGTPVTQELLDEVDTIVQGIGQQFFAAVHQGRGLTSEQLAAVTTGQVWLAPQARRLRLIDGIETFAQALDAAGTLRTRRRKEQAAAYETLIARHVHLQQVFAETPQGGDVCAAWPNRP